MFEKTKTFYACGVDWDHEMGEASDLEGKMPLYSSLPAPLYCAKLFEIAEISLGFR